VIVAAGSARAGERIIAVARRSFSCACAGTALDFGLLLGFDWASADNQLSALSEPIGVADG
jgi:hypothetical protein